MIKEALTEILRGTRGLMAHTFSWFYASDFRDILTAIFVTLLWVVELLIAKHALKVDYAIFKAFDMV